MLLCARAFAAITIVGTPTANYVTSATNVSCSAINVATGNALAVFVGFANTNLTYSISDTAGNSFSALSLFVGSTQSLGWSYIYSATGNAADVIKVTASGTANSLFIHCIQFSYTGSLIVDGAGTQNNYGLSGSYTTSNFTTTHATEIALAGFRNNNSIVTWTQGTGYTLAAQDHGSTGTSATEYQIFSSTTTTNAQISASASHGASSYVLLLGIQTATTCQPTLMLLGVSQCGD